MLLTIIIIIAIVLSACGENSSENSTASSTESSSQDVQTTTAASGETYLDYFAQAGGINKSFGELNEEYGLTESGATDAWYLYTSDDGRFCFGFRSTSLMTIDNGVGGTEEVPGPPLDSDLCLCVAGTAEDMLGITETISAKDFAISCESQLLQGMESGHGLDVETSGNTGLAAIFTLDGEDTYHILLQDVTDDGDINPDTTVHVLYHPEGE